MQSNQFTRTVCWAITTLAFGCGGATEDLESPDLDTAGDEVELGTAEQTITTDTTTTGRVVGSTELNGRPGAQASSSVGGNHFLPGTPVLQWRFTGLNAADTTLMRTAALNGKADIAGNGVAVSGSESSGSARIKVVQLADDGNIFNGNITDFFSVTCQAGSLLGEAQPLPGLWFKTSTGSDSCTIGVKEAKIKRLIAGVTPQARVRRHGMAWGFAGIMGGGDTSQPYSNFLTSRQVNQNSTKSVLPPGQVCLLNGVDTLTGGNTLSIANNPNCAELPAGY